MSDLHERLFEALEPPRGGLAGLHARIERDVRRRVRRRRVQAVAAAVIVALAGWWVLVPHGGPRSDSPELDLARLGLGQISAPTEPLTIPADTRARMAARRVPVGSDKVAFYLVASVQDDVAAGAEERR